MKKIFRYSLLLLAGLAGFSTTYATKLVRITAVDKDYIMIYFKDGEVFYKDDPTRTDGYLGHDVHPGSDSLISYGQELDTKIASDPSSWLIVSKSDREYGKKGLMPVKVFRKSKVNNTDQNWNYKLDHWIYLELPHSMKQGSRYTLKISPGTRSDTEKIELNFDLNQSFSEAIHVNLIGYAPGSPVKSADLYLWMGDGGARDYSSFEGKKAWLYNVESGKRMDAGEVTFWKRSATEAEDRNMTGSDVWKIDFDAVTKPGKYRLVVEDVGCSMDFEISDNVYFEPYKYSVRGFFYMRVGQDGEGLSPVPRRPLYIPGKDPEGFTVYITDLDPWDKDFRDWRGDTWDEPHWRPAKESIFWKHRLPGNPVNPNAYGGHADAADWDRHLGHVSIIYDLLLPYFLSGGELNDDDLDIAESRNGIPDIIDEARDEVDMWLRLRDGDAYSHGLTNPTQERTAMFQAGATTMAAWANAANCAMLADCFRISGHKDLEEYYMQEAVKAFQFAEKQDNRQLDDLQGVGDVSMRGRDFKMMAAAFLYNVTGERKWEDIMASESLVRDKIGNIESKRDGVQTWGTAAYIFTSQDRHYPALYENMKKSVFKQAIENNVRYMNIRPSRRSSNNNWFQTPENLHMVVLAHAFSDDPVDRELLERSMVLEADWGLGRNPSNTVEMTGLGERHIVNCFTTGHNDGTPGMHPGHTPYNNLDPWGGRNEGSNPLWFTERGYPEWKDGWPHQEAFFNCRYSWANAEFTPQQTMRGKMLLLGYLNFIY